MQPQPEDRSVRLGGCQVGLAERPARISVSGQDTDDIVLADIRDMSALESLFASHRPDVVFHAAAYKHVAMMEANPLEAVRNNTLATRVLADVAIDSKVKTGTTPCEAGRDATS